MSFIYRLDRGVASKIRRLVIAAIPLLLLVSGITVGTSVLSASPACAKESAKAAVIVKYEEGREDRVCIELGIEDPSGSISGIEALRKTGLTIVTKTDPSFGEQVCKIVEVGTDDCAFTSGYWAYWHIDPTSGEWTASDVGASTYQVTDGTIEGWVWTSPDEPFPPTNQPEPANLDEICVQSAPAPPVEEPKEQDASAVPWIILGLTAFALIIGTIVSRKIGGGAG